MDEKRWEEISRVVFLGSQYDERYDFYAERRRHHAPTDDYNAAALQAMLDEIRNYPESFEEMRAVVACAGGRMVREKDNTVNGQRVCYTIKSVAGEFWYSVVPSHVMWKDDWLVRAILVYDFLHRGG